MSKILVIPVEGPLVEEEIDGESLSTLQRLVGGGFIESVVVPDFIKDAEHASAFINEEGKFREDLKPNMRATDFLVPGVGLFMGDHIAGPFVLAGDDGEGGIADVPAGIVERARLIESEAA